MNAKWYVLIILLSLFYTKQSNAQYLSVNGDFSVDQIRGCTGMTVTVTNINPGNGSIQFQFEGDTSTPLTNPVFTYTKDSTYWLIQTISGNSGAKQDSILITVLLPELPDVDLLSCNNLELLVQINDSFYDEYEVDYGDGTITTFQVGAPIPTHIYANANQRNVVVTGLFTTATNRCGATSILFDPTINVLPAQVDSLIALNATSLKLNYQLPANSINKLEVSVNNNLNYVLYSSLAQNTAADTISSLNLSQNRYCFRIATYDACSNFKSYSNEVCSVDLLKSAQNNQITLDFNTIDLGVGQTINIIRDGLIIQNLPFPISQHIDSTVVCNTTYSYIAEVNFTGGATSHSLTLSETAFSTDIPPIIENISSVTNTDSIDWVWPQPLNTIVSHYIVHQVNNAGDILKSDSVGSNSYKNSFDDVVKMIAVEAHDICNNVSPIGNVGNNLLVEVSITSTYDIQLNWNNYVGWFDGLQEYYITIKNDQGDVIDSSSTSSSTIYTLALNDQVDQTLFFTVWAIPILGGIEFSRSNILRFERNPIIAIPNSFTPNGDGLNDTFIISGKFIQSYELQVFNRWGEVLFHSTDLENGWDGTANNQTIPAGNYAYWMRIKDLNNNDHIRTGSILILSN